MSFTEEDLNWLNQYVYNVDQEKLERPDLDRPLKNEPLVLKNKTEVYVVDMVDDNKTGYQGMAIAPIVNNKPDYNQITVVSAGTDPSQTTTDLWSSQFNGQAPFHGRGQVGAAEDFVNKINNQDHWTVTQLSGYSQSAYMLKVGAKLEIPTTVFNGWFLYTALSPEEQEFMKNNPHLFINYRHNSDMVTALNDANGSWYGGEDFGTIVWIEGSSHNIYDWKFDKETGKLIISGADQEKSDVRLAQVENQSAVAMWQLLQLKKRLKASGGGLSSNEAIYLDDSQALVAVNTASQMMKIGLASVIKIYQEAITEAEGLWDEGIKLAQTLGSELTHSETTSALARGGATRASIVDASTTFYEEKIAKAKKIGESFDSLVAEIQAGIQKLVQSDQELASQIG